MQYGHSNRALIEIILKPKALKVWSLSRQICGELLGNLSDMKESESDYLQVKITHEEEGKARKLSDAEDRKGIRRMLGLFIDSLNPSEHSEQILNIVS